MYNLCGRRLKSCFKHAVLGLQALLVTIGLSGGEVCYVICCVWNRMWTLPHSYGIILRFNLYCNMDFNSVSLQLF